MYKNFSIGAFLFFCVLINGLNAQPITENNSKEDIKKTLWKGFKHYDFKFEQRDVRLIVPNKPHPLNPWLWRARFPDWHIIADSILVSEGFHIVYINTNNKYGSPESIRIWDKLYRHVIEKYKLSKKVALCGVSRGGLFVYNWAKKNPEKVACIYTEAPVCDFKSWPAGFGASEGSAKDWEKLKEEYGFSDDDDAKVYSNNPIDNLETLAEKKCLYYI